MKYEALFIDEQDTRQNTELKKSIVQCFIVSVMSFHVYFDKQVHTKMEKKKASKKIKGLNFAESNAN